MSFLIKSFTIKLKMKKIFKNFLINLGNLFNLLPQISIDEFCPPRRSPEKQVENAWELVGSAFRQAITNFEKEINLH